VAVDRIPHARRSCDPVFEFGKSGKGGDAVIEKGCWSRNSVSGSERSNRLGEGQDEGGVGRVDDDDEGGVGRVDDDDGCVRESFGLVLMFAIAL
jgi:hypothetical protein